MWYPVNNSKAVNTFDIFEQLNKELNKLVCEPASAAHDFLPSISLKKGDGLMELEASLPGIKPESINLEVAGKEVILAVKQEKSEEKATRRSCDFSRKFSLPFQIDSEKVKANYEHGLLTVELPQVEAEKPKKIKVNI